MELFLYISRTNIYFMKYILFIIASLIFNFSLFSQKYITSTGQISIKGESPVTDVEAVSKKLNGAFKTDTREFQFKIDMTSLDFPNDEMENHYNEKYMETDQEENRYGTFTGKILSSEDIKKPGKYKVVAQGVFKIHNVEVSRNIIITLTVEDGKIKAEGDFLVPLKDHKIKVPSLAFAKIGENIKVNISIIMTPSTK